MSTYFLPWLCWLFFSVLIFHFLKIYFIYLFLERGEGREKERKRSVNVIEWLLLRRTPTGDWTHNPGTCPDGELNQWPFNFVEWWPTNWATVVRADEDFFKRYSGFIFRWGLSEDPPLLINKSPQQQQWMRRKKQIVKQRASVCFGVCNHQVRINHLLPSSWHSRAFQTFPGRLIWKTHAFHLYSWCSINV